MKQLYAILAKKSMAITLGAVVLFGSVPGSAVAKTPNDPRYIDQVYLEQIGLPAAWDYTIGSKKVIVAVIDTGVDTWHPDLVDNIWTNRGEVPDNQIDDDRNGYVDDVHGWNFVENNNDPRVSVFDEVDSREPVSHGTVAAGIIGAAGNNGTDGSGVNWNVNIMPIRAFTSSGKSSYAQISSAVDYAVRNGAQVISMSFNGSSYDEQLRETLRRAYDSGVLVVAAAGNHDQNVSGDLSINPTYPACYDRGNTENWVLTVGSSNELNRLSRFSNFGPCVDLVAPGEGIYSTERYAPAYGYVNSFGGPWRGTSFATPLVAGTGALIKSLHPEWGPREIINTILSTTDTVDLSGMAGVVSIGSGRLNIGRAVALAAVTGSTQEVVEPEAVEETVIYAFKGSELWRHSLVANQRERVQVFKGAQIISVAPSPEGGVYILMKQGSTYSLRMLDESGTTIRTQALRNFTKYGVPRQLGVVNRGDGIYPLIEFRLAKTGVSTFVELDKSTRSIKQVAVKAVLPGWKIGRENTLVYAETVKTGTVLRQIDWFTGRKQSYELSGVKSVSDMVVGRVGESGAEYVVLIVERAGLVEQVTVDIGGKTEVAYEEIGSVQKNKRSRLALLAIGNGKMGVIRFMMTGGDAEVKTLNGRTLTTLPMQSFGTLQW